MSRLLGNNNENGHKEKGRLKISSWIKIIGFDKNCLSIVMSLSHLALSWSCFVGLVQSLHFFLPDTKILSWSGSFEKSDK